MSNGPARPRVRIGEMLIAAGILKQLDLDRALVEQKKTGARLGEVLVELGLVTEVQLTQMVSNQLSVPWVSLYHVEFSRELLNLVPPATAEKYCLVPIYVREVRGQGRVLFVAMDDPSNEEALRTTAEQCAMPVKPMVAPPTEIRNAIRVYYFGRSPEPAKAAATPPREATPAKPVERAPEPTPAKPAAAA